MLLSHVALGSSFEHRRDTEIAHLRGEPLDERSSIRCARPRPLSIADAVTAIASGRILMEAVFAPNVAFPPY